MKTGKTIVKEFIKNNGLDFSGSGSDLNGNCVTLAGFICYIIDDKDTGYDIIGGLKLSTDAEIELYRVFEYAWMNDYEEFWKTPKAKELYKFE